MPEQLPSLEKLQELDNDIHKIRVCGTELHRLTAIWINSLYELEDFIHKLIKQKKVG